MKQTYLFPPNYQQIVKAFPHVRHKPVLFAYGDTIYNPMRTKIPPTLIAHEAVHAGQQRMDWQDPTQWWDRYIADKEFRLRQEIPAHIAEYKAQATLRQLTAIAKRLASSLYGDLIDYEHAYALILDGAREVSTATTQVSDMSDTSDKWSNTYVRL